MRKDWPAYFLDIAQQVSERSTCQRAHVGAVLVRDRHILATGYNGSMPGDKHCEDEGCWVVDNHCVRTVHAEANAIAQAAKHGVAIAGATAYITIRPCFNCLKLMVNAGIERVYYRGEYGTQLYPSPIEVIQIVA